MASDWSSGIDLLLDIDHRRGLRAGIEQALRDAMRDGRLALGTSLPSSRSLARDLHVARGTVSAAYYQLAAEGYLDIRPGASARVRWQLQRHPPTAARIASDQQPLWDLRPGHADNTSFPRQAWTRAHRHVMARTSDDIFGYGDPRGHAQLRHVLADYLGRARGVDTNPQHLVICSGFTQALTVTCRVLRAAGITSLAVEDPSAPRYTRLAEAAGLNVIPVSCDQDGLRADLLADSGARAVLVTPAHQYPLGITMAAARRVALAEWARRQQAFIIEDDYDGEFRYDRHPLGAMQRLDPDHVIYIGTASKTLAPALRLGWLSPPETINEACGAAKRDLDRGNSVLDQLTFAQLIASGAFDQHVRRMRERYRRRRDELAHTITSAQPGMRVAGVSAGLHATIFLPPHGSSEQQIQARAARAGIALETLGSYWHNPSRPCPPAMIIGYATPASHAYHPALHALRTLLTAESRC